MVRATFALLVFLVEAWALAQVFASPAPRSGKFRWAAAIVLLPVLGVLLWLRMGPRPSRRARQSI